MIASCSKCRTNYNIDESRVQGGRVLLRCQVCGHWFSVAVKSEPEQIVPEPAPQTEEPIATSTATNEELPTEQLSKSEPEPQIEEQVAASPAINEEPPTEQPIESQPEQIIDESEYQLEEPAVANSAFAEELPPEQKEPQTVQPETANSETEPPAEETKPAYLKLLVADTPTQFRTRVVKTLNEIDPTLELVVVDDGGLAMGALAGFAPDLAIIGTAIEKVYCFEICDYMRATDRLKDTRIVFAAELHQAAWNCADPESLYGADAWMSNAATDDELFAGLRDHIETVRTNHQQTPS